MTNRACSFSILLSFYSFSTFLLHLLAHLGVSLVAVLVGVGGRYKTDKSEDIAIL